MLRNAAGEFDGQSDECYEAMNALTAADRPVLYQTTDTGDGLLSLLIDPETGRVYFYGKPR